MGIREALRKMNEKKKREKEQFKQMQKQKRWNEKLEAMDKSSNERELEKLMKEQREKQIKEDLDYMRRKRKEEIDFGHNPIDTPNITKAKWEVMKEKNQFSGKGNIFSNQDFIHKSDKKLLNSGRVLKNKKSMMSGEFSL